MWGRCTGDVGEMYARCRRDVGQEARSGRSLAACSRAPAWSDFFSKKDELPAPSLARRRAPAEKACVRQPRHSRKRSSFSATIDLPRAWKRPSRSMARAAPSAQPSAPITRRRGSLLGPGGQPWARGWALERRVAARAPARQGILTKF